MKNMYFAYESLKLYSGLFFTKISTISEADFYCVIWVIKQIGINLAITETSKDNDCNIDNILHHSQGQDLGKSLQI